MVATGLPRIEDERPGRSASLVAGRDAAASADIEKYVVLLYADQLQAEALPKAFTLRIPDGPELSIDVDAVHGPADSAP